VRGKLGSTQSFPTAELATAEGQPHNPAQQAGADHSGLGKGMTPRPGGTGRRPPANQTPVVSMPYPKPVQGSGDRVPSQTIPRPTGPKPTNTSRTTNTSLETLGLNPHPRKPNPHKPTTPNDTNPPRGHPHQTRFRPIIDQADQEAVARAFWEAGLDTLARKIAECGQRYQVALCRRCHRHRVFPTHCDTIWCPRCAAIVAARRAAIINEWARQIPYPKHVVLTVRASQQPLAQQIQNLVQAIGKLRRRKICRAWIAGIWRLEVTWAPAGWHPHLHLLVDAPYTDQAALAKAWAEILGQDVAIVWIAATTPAEYIHEVTKYVTKPTAIQQIPPERLRELVAALTRHRTMGTWGLLRHRNTTKYHPEQQNPQQGLTCECGAQDWKWYSDNEWEWFCAIHGIPEPVPVTLQTQPQPEPSPPQ
jgi:hypothetical protein